jgi:hypothetical protein
MFGCISAAAYIDLVTNAKSGFKISGMISKK